MAFPITGGFCDACEAKCPVALVLVAYYLVVVRLLPDIWPVGRMADRGIQVIAGFRDFGSKVVFGFGNLHEGHAHDK